MRLLLILVLQLALFHIGSECASPKDDKSAKIEALGESGLNRITLTPKAAERLGIKTSKVREETIKSNPNHESESVRKVVPYAAVIYDINGDTWVYVFTKPLAFVRHRIVVDKINGDKAILSEGPAVGAEIVTIGVIELYGAEKGIGK